MATAQQLQREREKLRGALHGISDKLARAMGLDPELTRENIRAELDQVESELRDALRRRQAKHRRSR